MKKLSNSIVQSELSRKNQPGKFFRIVCRSTIYTLRAFFLPLAVTGITLGSPGLAMAANLPSGAEVMHGQMEMENLSADSMRIIQDSQSAIVNWQSFDIGKGALVDIVQPNMDAAMLSRVVGGNLSQIHGNLRANGHLYLINPNGIIFGSDAQIDVNALIASSLDLGDSDFLSGKFLFNGDSEAPVMNLGSIKSDEFAVLIGNKVTNTGTIKSPGGAVGLLADNTTFEIGEASGGKISMDISGLLSGEAMQGGSLDTANPNGDGGKILVQGTQRVTASAGSISDASSGSLGDGGKVIYFSDDTAVWEPSASILSEGGTYGGDGGFVELSGLQNVQLNGAFISTNAESGETGMFLIDPVDIKISSS